MIEIRPSLGRSLTTLSLEETFPWPSQQATKTPRDGLEIGLLLNKQAALYLQCTSKYGKHISRPLQFHKRKTQLGVCEHSSEVWERRGTRRGRKKKKEDTANPIKTALETCLEVLHLSGTEWNQSDASHSPRAAGWQQPRSLGASVSVKCQQLIKEHRAACDIRMHSRKKVNFTEVYFKSKEKRLQTEKLNLY